MALPTVHTGDFGRYTLQRLLARGGMGEVHLARLQGAAGWEKEVVVKRLLPHLMDDPEFVARFLDEARIAVTLSHGNIVPVFDMGEVEGSYFLAMEYVDGWDVRAVLRHVQRQGQTVPVGLALFIAAEVCRGLAYAHQRTDASGAPLGIVHRDISPSNILLSRDGDVKVTDFGIALARSRAVQTLTGQLKGKLAYMSPEQARGQSVDQRSDLYALGLVLFEMISGQRVYDAATDVEILARVGRGERPVLVEVMPDVDPEVAAVVERALQTDPSRRYADADAMQVDLMRVLFRETGPVTGRQLAAWLARIAPPREQPGGGGARLDDLLLANLASGGQTPTSMPTPGLRPTGTLTVAPQASPPPTPPASEGIPPGGRAAATPVAPVGSSAAAAELGVGGRPAAATPPRGGRRAALLVAALVLVGLVVGAVGLLRAPAQYEIVSIPDGASVYLDGAPVGVTRLLTEVPPGSHTVRVAMAGYEPWTAQLDARRGEQLRVEAVLSREAVSASIDSVPPGAMVEIVGEPGRFAAGTSRRLLPDVPVQVRLTLPGYLPHEETWTPSGPAPRLTVRLEPAAVVAQAVDPLDQALTTVERTPPGSAEDPAATEVRQTNRPPEPGDTRLERPPREPAVDVVEPVAGPPGGVRLFFPDTPMVGELFVDGVSMGRVESGAEVALSAGSYALEVRNDPNQKRHGARVEIRPGEVTRHDVRWER